MQLLTAENVEVIALREKAKARAGHARSCKKAPADCPLCKAAIAFFNEIPTTLLSRVLAE